ncbi:MAG TPA: hypothetical protein VLA93_08450 [Pyrinomonadaceae bacterium]|nr:hypothetical protein [Pyrinomonadaceae bacterium]
MALWMFECSINFSLSSSRDSFNFFQEIALKFLKDVEYSARLDN